MKRILPLAFIILCAAPALAQEATVNNTLPKAVVKVSPERAHPALNQRALGTAIASALQVSDPFARRFQLKASDPSSPSNGTVWYNTTSNTYKGRQGGSTVTFQTSAFSGGAVTSPITGPDGSASAPSYSFTNNTNMGFFRSANNLLGISVAGVERIDISQTALVAASDGGMDIGNGASDFRDLSLKRNLTLRGATSGSVTLSASGTGGNVVIGNLTITNPGSAITATLPSTSFTVARTDAANTFTGTQSFSGQISSSLATGTAPLSVTSTTPVANLSATPTTYNSQGTQQTNAHVVVEAATLSGGTVTVVLQGSSAFTSNSTYQCGGVNYSNANAFKITKTSGSQITITGTGTDIIGVVCVGN